MLILSLHGSNDVAQNMVNMSRQGVGVDRFNCILTSACRFNFSALSLNLHRFRQGSKVLLTVFGYFHQMWHNVNASKSTTEMYVL